mgnify:FL=1
MGGDSMILLKFGVAVLLSLVVYYIAEKSQNWPLKWLLSIK